MDETAADCVFGRGDAERAHACCDLLDIQRSVSAPQAQGVSSDAGAEIAVASPVRIQAVKDCAVVSSIQRGVSRRLVWAEPTNEERISGG